MALTRRARRRLFLLFGLAVVALAAGSIAWTVRQVVRDRAAAVARIEGLALWAAGDFDEALPRLSIAVARNKGDVELLVAFADTRSRLPTARNKHILSAVGLYRRALIHEPENVAALRGLMQLQLRAGLLTQLIDTANDLRKVEPLNPAPLKILREVAQYRGRLAPAPGTEGTEKDDSALRWADALIDIEPEVIQHRLDLLLIMEQTGYSRDDQLALAESWAADASNSDGRFDIVLAQVCATHKLVEAAERAALKGVGKALDDPHALLISIGLLERLGNEDAAADLLNRAEQRALKEPSIARAMILMAWREGSMSLVRQRLEKFDGTLSKSTLDLLFLTQLNAALGRTSEVEETLRIVREADRAPDLDASTIEQMDAWIAFLDFVVDFESADLPPEERVQIIHAAEGAAAPIIIREFASLILGALNQRVGLRTASMSNLRVALDPSGTLHVVPAKRLIDGLLEQGRVLEALPTAELLVRRHPRSLVAGIEWIRVRAAIERHRLDAASEGAVLRPFETSYEVARGIAESLDNPSMFQPILLEAALASGLAEEAREVVARVLNDPQTSNQGLLVVGQLVAESELLADVQSILGRIAHQLSANDASTTIQDAMAVLRARSHRSSGQFGEAVSLIETHFGSREDPRALHLLARERVDGAIATDSDLLADRVRELLELDVGYADMVDLIPTAIALDDLGLALEMKARIEALLGPESRPTILVEADISLGFPDADWGTEPSIRSLHKLVGALELQLDLEPNDGSLVERQFQLLDRLEPEDPSSATELLLQMVIARPEALRFYPPLIAHLQQMGRFEESDRLLDRFERRKLEVSPALRQAVDQLRLGQGDPEAALAALRRTAEAPGAAVLDQLRYFDMLVLSLKNDEAMATLARLSSDPGRPVDVDRRMALDHARAGRLEEAILVLREAPGFANEIARAHGVASLHLALEQPQAAIEELHNLPGTLQSSASANLLLAQAQLSIAELSLAQQSLRRAIELAPKSESVKIAIARIMMTSPQLRSSARGLLRQLRETTAQIGVVESMLLAIAAAGGSDEFDPRPEHLAQAVALTERYPSTRLTWELATQIFATSIRRLERKIQRMGREPTLDLDDLAAARQQHRKLVADFETILKNGTNRFASNSEFPRNLAYLNFMNQDFEEALRFATLAAKRTPGDRVPDAIAQARALQALDRTQAVIAILTPHAAAIIEEARTQDSPGSDEAYQLLVAALLKTGNVEEATRTLDLAGASPFMLRHWEIVARTLPPEIARQAIAILAAHLDASPGSTLKILLALTDVVRKSSDEDTYEEASGLIDGMNAAMSPAGDRTQAEQFLAAQVMLATAGLQETRSSVDARDSYAAVVEMVPTSIRSNASELLRTQGTEGGELSRWIEVLLIALNNQAAMATHDGLQINRGLGAINEALSIASNQPELLDTRALLYLAADRGREAVADARRATQYEPNRLTFKLTLANGLIAIGDTSAALALLQEIRRANLLQPIPDEGLAVKVAAALEALRSKQAG